MTPSAGSPPGATPPDHPLRETITDLSDGEAAERAARENVVPLELFLDLVIVFAFTQVITLMSADPTWAGVAHGLLLLIALWWLWTGFARLTNAVDPEEGAVRMVMLGATAALLVISLAAPRSFGRDAVTFAVAYAVARALHVVLSAIASQGDATLRRETVRLIPNALIASQLLLGAAVLGGWLRSASWVAVAVVSYLGVLVNGDRGWQVSPRHFIERFAQIILIALGESIVAIGIGAQDLRLDAGVIVAALLGITAIACLWWTYFDWVLYVVLSRFNHASPTACGPRPGMSTPTCTPRWSAASFCSRSGSRSASTTQAMHSASCPPRHSQAAWRSTCSPMSRSG